jgi:hypothetical protein
MGCFKVSYDTQKERQPQEGVLMVEKRRAGRTVGQTALD